MKSISESSFNAAVDGFASLMDLKACKTLALSALNFINTSFVSGIFVAVYILKKNILSMQNCATLRNCENKFKNCSSLTSQASIAVDIHVFVVIFHHVANFFASKVKFKLRNDGEKA